MYAAPGPTGQAPGPGAGAGLGGCPSCHAPPMTAQAPLSTLTRDHSRHRVQPPAPNRGIEAAQVSPAYHLGQGPIPQGGSTCPPGASIRLLKELSPHPGPLPPSWGAGLRLPRAQIGFLQVGPEPGVSRKGHAEAREE